MAKVLITGGAGFIGSHAADALLAAGYDVRVLDNLSPQVHGAQRHRPPYLNKEAELIVGDVTDALSVERALRGAGGLTPPAMTVATIVPPFVSVRPARL